MLFSSPLFLYLFLPLTLLGYHLCFGKRLKNYWLLITSLIFFAWGGVSYTIILISSIILNYFFGRLIQSHLDSKKAYRYLSIGVTCNILFLGVFKYANFFTENINYLFKSLHLPEVPQTDINLPIGISFYTFHSLSYLIDIYRRKTNAQKNILDLSLYICMFSQLIAGPIIRYSEIYTQLGAREHSLAKFSRGVERFIIGLGKKVLLANIFAQVADELFKKDSAELGSLNAWLGIFCYTLQIYYDFSGYSDMAIGLGRMFGFEFMENFNFPYIARSIKEFWRRWHISLSTFFRDYVYIPLGGNRVSKQRFYLNLVIVFFLTGFWHGASWSFVVWGLFHGSFIILEHLGLEKILIKLPKVFSNAYTLVVVMLGWVLFRSDTLTYALNYWKVMFSFSSTPVKNTLFFSFMGIEFYVAACIAVAGALGLFDWIYRRTRNIITKEKPLTILNLGYHTFSAVAYVLILVLSTMYLIAESYNPFIYFKF
jgi:alginate O-acetyltransferase complex protein AlgI